ncbi:MAG: single-stranded DNA-binding protein [Clostridia bacterium]|nr:single-stranded DNA-binding protein [Clostridia bacterium]
MLNKVILQGRLTDHPELKHTNSGKAVTSFSIAVEDNRTINGERKVNFFKIEAWNAAAEFVCKYFEKGQQIIVDGRLTINTYNDKNGNTRKDVYIVADGINFCGAKSSEAQEKDIDVAFENNITENIE